MFSDLNSFSFVQSASWDLHRVIEGQGRKRFAPLCRAASGLPEADSKAEAKKLTVAVKWAPSAKKLLEIFDGAVDRAVFDFIMASAAYTRPAHFTKRRGVKHSDWDSPVLARLHARVEDMAQQDQLNEQATANILWSLAELSDRFSIPGQLLAALVASMGTKMGGMDEQGLSNSLLACVKLKDVDPNVLRLVPGIAARIHEKAEAMIPQQLSNCLWACLRLEDEVPEARDIVPEIVKEIPARIENMNLKDLSGLQILFLFQEPVPEIASFLTDSGSKHGIVRSAAGRLRALLPQLGGKDLNIAVGVVVWACGKVGVCDHDLLMSVANKFNSRRKLSSLKDFTLCALLWSYGVLDVEDKFTNFRKLLKSETKRRDFSEADVQSSELGYLKWSRAKV